MNKLPFRIFSLKIILMQTGCFTGKTDYGEDQGSGVCLTLSLEAVYGSITCLMSLSKWPTFLPTCPRLITKVCGCFLYSSSPPWVGPDLAPFTVFPFKQKNDTEGISFWVAVVVLRPVGIQSYKWCWWLLHEVSYHWGMIPYSFFFKKSSAHFIFLFTHTFIHICINCRLIFPTVAEILNVNLTILKRFFLC